MARESGLTETCILVADDHAIVRRGVRSLLETQPGWRVCEAASGDQAVEMAKILHPDVATLDISMPGLDGLHATLCLLKALPELPVLILTMQSDRQFIEAALDAGARGYVLKSDAETELIAAVQALLDHRTYFTSATSTAVLGKLRRAKTREYEPSAPKRRALDMHQREIVQMLVSGKTNKEVAARFHISVRTAEYHRSRIMRTLEVSSISELVRYAVRNAIIEP